MILIVVTRATRDSLYGVAIALASLHVAIFMTLLCKLPLKKSHLPPLGGTLDVSI